MLPIFVATNTYVSYTHKHLYWESLYQLLHLKKTLGFIPIIMFLLGIIVSINRSQSVGDNQ